MRKDPARHTTIALLLASAALFLFFVAGYFFLPSFTGLSWRGYYTVLLEKEADIREASRRMAEGGLGKVLSAATAEVEFSDFDRMEKIPVAGIAGRLHPEDPRLDEFLRGAERLFRSGSGRDHIVYVPARVSPPFLAARLRSALPDTGFAILEWHGGRRFVILFFFLLVAAAVVLREEENRLLYAAFALPWLGFFFHGSPGGFAAGMLLYAGLASLLEEVLPRFDHFLYDRDAGFSVTPALKERAACSGAAALGAVLVVFLSDGPSAMVPVLFGIGGSAALAAAAALLRLNRLSGREHRLFIPLPILPRLWRGGPPSGRRRFSVLILILLLAVPAAYKAAGNGEGVLVPRPHRVSGIGGMSRENLRELWLANRGEKLPDFSDYLCHRAFQQGFFHGYPQEFPAPEARVTISRFSLRDGRIVRGEDVLAKYDEAWYKGELKTAKKSGLGALLYAQGPRGVSLESAGDAAMNAAYFIRYGVFVTLAYLPLLFASRGARPGLMSLVKSFMPRRKQQEA